MNDGNGLIMVVGPSGVGKDSLLNWLRSNAPTQWQLLCAPRYCTRPAGPGEAHIAVSTEEFALIQASGSLALSWAANGLHYGISRDIEHWLAHGCRVLVNGSRGHLATALGQYPQARVLEIGADPEVLARRLQQRGREDYHAIVARLARTPAMALPAHIAHQCIYNNHDLPSCGQQALAVFAQWFAAEHVPEFEGQLHSGQTYLPALNDLHTESSDGDR